MTWETAGALALIIVAGILWRKAWQWKQQADQARVRTKDPDLFKDQQPRSNPVITASFQTPAAKFINGHRQRDRQAHMRQLDRKDRN